MKIIFIKNGNLSPWLSGLFLVVGVAAVVLSLCLDLSGLYTRKILFWSGFFVAAIGGYASKADALHLRPFGDSYKKIRKSYMVEDEGKSENSDDVE